ncbi:hypothetical protein ACG2F4_07420 [Halalkalibaculum sp. DA3122]|uniref:hypothetical protein n=1 Tax=Halalkalibaculum sp. DA3122 TaxID=3373607 RepID=UPI0037552305
MNGKISGNPIMANSFCTLISGLLLCLWGGSLAGCEQTFEPYKENNEFHFSFYGYLDASADTQWVRISPARVEFQVPTDAPDAVVTLEEMETGHSAVLEDSLFERTGGYNYWNYWTTMDVRAEHTYRLLAESPDGATSSVTVTIPPDFPKPRIGYHLNGCQATLSIRGVERLADAQSVWRYSAQQLYRFPYRIQAYGGVSGFHTIELNAIRERTQIPVAENVDVQSRYVMVAAGGPEWVEGVDSLDDPTYTLPEGFSNVQNGLGYMVGILSKTTPYEECH